MIMQELVPHVTQLVQTVEPQDQMLALHVRVVHIEHLLVELKLVPVALDTFLVLGHALDV